MLKKRLLILITPIFLATGCVSLYNGVEEMITGSRIERAEDAMASWVGNHVDDVITAWGKPASIHTNQDGSMLYDYSYTVQTTRQATYNVYGQVLTPGESYSRTCNRAFLVNQHGVIIKWRVTTPTSCEYTGRRIATDIPIPESTF